MIRAEALTKSYGRKPVLTDVTFTVPQQSVFALVGSNGAGKTTTLKILMNILRADAGHAELLGTPSPQIDAPQLQQIGYVSENQEMPGRMRVGEFLAFLKPFYPQWDDTLVATLVRELQLPLEARIRDLSRGMRMKAALASSLVYRPKLLLLDEPFTGLDPLVRDEFIQSLLERAEELTILISSHDLSEIETFATHIAFLDAGRIQFSEELPTLLDRFREVEVVLDQPALPRPWPAHWLSPQTAAAVVRFIDSHYDSERSPSAVQHLFPNARDIVTRRIPLRSIFVTLAKQSRLREGVAA